MQESVDANNVARVPWFGCVQRPHVHLIQAESVGPEFSNHIIGVHHIAEAFAHLGDNAANGFSGVFGHKGVFGYFIHFIRRHKLTVVSLEGKSRQQSLVEQFLERLTGGQMAEVEQNLVPEACVQQVQRRVLRAADVQINPAVEPERFGFLGNKRFVVVGVAVANPVPT